MSAYNEIEAEFVKTRAKHDLAMAEWYRTKSSTAWRIAGKMNSRADGLMFALAVLCRGIPVQAEKVKCGDQDVAAKQNG